MENALYVIHMCVQPCLHVFVTSATMDRSKAAVFSVVESVYLMLTFAENAASKRKTGMDARK